MPNHPTLSDADKYLLPCPFCGGVAEFTQTDDTEGCPNWNAHVIGCRTCGASTKLGFSDKESAQEHLTMLWNQRINWTGLVAKLASRLRAVLEGGQEDRELLESFAECFGKGLYKPYTDHACIECDPTANGYPVTQGFRCCYHQLLARQSTPGE